MNSTPYPISASGQVGPQGAGGYCILAGVSLAETSGTATLVEIRDGGVVGGNVIAAFQLGSKGSTPLGDLPNVVVTGGIYVKITGGTIEGSIYIR